MWNQSRTDRRFLNFCVISKSRLLETNIHWHSELTWQRVNGTLNKTEICTSCLLRFCTITMLQWTRFWNINPSKTKQKQQQRARKHRNIQKLFSCCHPSDPHIESPSLLPTIPRNPRWLWSPSCYHESVGPMWNHHLLDRVWSLCCVSKTSMTETIQFDKRVKKYKPQHETSGVSSLLYVYFVFDRWAILFLGVFVVFFVVTSNCSSVIHCVDYVLLFISSFVYRHLAPDTFVTHVYTDSYERWQMNYRVCVFVCFCVSPVSKVVFGAFAFVTFSHQYIRASISVDTACSAFSLTHSWY